MLKKILLIAFPLLIILVLGGYILLNREGGSVGETVLNELPFGSPSENIPQNTPPTIPVETPGVDSSTPQTDVFRLVSTPVAGFVSFSRGTSTVVRYVDRATGHISDVILRGEEPIQKARITNTTLPKIYQAHFRSDGTSVVIRSLEENLDTVRNLSLTLIPPPTTSTTTRLYSVSATNLRGDMDSITPGSGNTLFYVAKDNSSILSSNFTGTGLRNLFNSPFHNWRLSRAGANLLIHTKADSRAPGYAYTLNTSSGGLSKVVGPLNGLTALSNGGELILHSYVEGGLTKLFVKNTRTGSASEILPATLAEKCIWSTLNKAIVYCGVPLTGINGREPENWYLGRTHFVDYVWRFDTDSETAQLIAEPKTELNLNLDLSDLHLSPDENYLFFINKTDQTLWALNLKQA